MPLISGLESTIVHIREHCQVYDYEYMKKIKTVTLGDRLRDLRGDMTQQEFADLIGIGRTTLIKYESNERAPDAQLIVKLNVLFGVDPLWLLTGNMPGSKNEKASPREARLLQMYRQLNEQGQAAIENMAKALTAKGGK